MLWGDEEISFNEVEFPTNFTKAVFNSTYISEHNCEMIRRFPIIGRHIGNPIITEYDYFTRYPTKMFGITSTTLSMFGNVGTRFVEVMI
jgi:hypothetical protein